ncbi:VOC family protein [Pluralibacter gergoviae]|uniref:Glyoxalase n=1 Tax=Pluralibacter gergoviae TaxID=61647 RepID=A0A0J5LV42_PLUGE|nr:VOC family protein [Pluralibacter gergoviae]EKV0917468.1 VOC family protein [Pluralibacter gergoviae]EKV9909613.1 VOC family protein [Pluralibacter gergoviae]EKW7275945.1 VOC family protein [Pluralibacter gergoviae]EKZ9515493.1 VOC family protein [Pluralibacter gergoviae]ELC3017543.1 VOC family protein [Pluralibacter gergoviae]
MSITGIEKLEFGVDNLSDCARFMQDFGLTGDQSGRQFTTLSGARIELNAADAPTLPPAFEAGNTLRRISWGVENQAALDALRPKLAAQPGFREVDGALECLDPNGMTLRIQISEQQPVALKVEPINQWGDVRRIDAPSPVYDRARPINVGHVVFFVEELAAVERFYREVLGFQVSDRYINRAVFLRCGTRGGHHNLFLLQLPNRRRGLNHVAFTVRDIHEVIGGGIAMNKNRWSTFIGPGRHPVSSAYFWYVNSPTGGAFEYYTNDDYLTENWQPRELEHSLVSFTEWAVEGGIDHDTRRQQKKSEAV